jgi:hypothetical protein
LEEELSDREGSGNVRLRQVWKPADAEKHSERRGSVYIEYMYVKPGAKTLTIEVVEQHNTKSKTTRRKSRASPHYYDSDSDSDYSGKRRLSMRRRSSKTVEVNLKSPSEPKTVVRARSPDVADDGKHGNEQTTDLPPLKTVKNRTKEPPPYAVLVDNYHENGVKDAISVVEDANSIGAMMDLSVPKMEVSIPQLTPKARPSQQFKALPVISENQALVNQQIVEEDEEEPEEPTCSSDTILRETMLKDAQVLIITPQQDDAASVRSRSRSSADSHDSTQKKTKKKPKNNVDYIRQRQLEMDEDRKKILDLPYTAYTRNKDGHVIAMLDPPKPMNTEPPSNYERYKRDKLLQRTRVKQRIENDHLQKFMEKIGDDGKFFWKKVIFSF